MGDPDYWSGLVVPGDWMQLARKYAALAELARMSPGQRPPALRRAARAWPGALREAELAGPDVCARRLAIARAHVCRPASTRAAARDDDDRLAAVLWSNLHAMLRDQLRFRERGAGGEAETFLRSPSPRARARWPSARILVERGGAKVRPRQAYLWLATQTGLSLVELNRCLFARTGHWDARDDDPEWTRIG